MAKIKKQNLFESHQKNTGFLKGVFSAVGLTLMMGATMMGLSSVNVALDLNKEDYKTPEQIYNDGAAYGTDMSIASYQNYFSEFTRLKHNNGEPIYVYISDDYNQREVALIKEMYANIEMYFQTINPNYKFDFVDGMTVANKSLQGKTVVTYGRMKMENGAGFCFKTPSLFNPGFTAKEIIMLDTSITIPEQLPNYSAMTEKEIQDYEDAFAEFRASIYEEGFYHGLGFANDVYFKNSGAKFYEFGLKATTENLHLNTFILNDSKRYMVDLFPEDYKMLQAMYNQNQNQEDVLQMIETYENIFYSSRKSAVESIVGSYSKNSEDYARLEPISQNDSEGILIQTSPQFNVYNKDNPRENLGLFVYDFDIILKDGLITIKVFDENTKELLETSSAKYKNIDGVIFVENMVFEKVKVTFNSGTSYNVDGKVINSFALAKTIWPEREKPRYMFFNYSTINRSIGHDEVRDANLFKQYEKELSSKYQTLQSKQQDKEILASSETSKIASKRKLSTQNMTVENFGNFSIAMESKFDSLKIIKNNEEEKQH